MGALGTQQGLRQKNEEGHRDDRAGTETARQMSALPHAPRKSDAGEVRQKGGTHDDDELNELHVRSAMQKRNHAAAMRQSHCRSASSFLNGLRNAEEQPAPRTELRSTHANPRSIADLIALVERIDHVEPGRERAGIPQMEDVVDTQVYL